VRLGQVEKVSFIRNEYDLSGQVSAPSRYESFVMVLCSVPRENLPEFSDEERIARLEHMISSGLRVRLASNLLTGQAQLQADYLDPNRFPVIEISWEPENLYVPSAPSTFTTVKDSIDKVLYKLQEIDIEKVVEAVEKVFVSLDKAVADADISGLSKEAKALLTETRSKVEKLNTEKISVAALQALASVDKAVADANVPKLSQEIQSLFAELRETNQNLKKLLASSKPDTGQSNLPEVIARLNKTLG
ncbi:unnamed protein product, partial [marine sediment metagenome]